MDLKTNLNTDKDGRKTYCPKGTWPCRRNILALSIGTTVSAFAVAISIIIANSLTDTQMYHWHLLNIAITIIFIVFCSAAIWVYKNHQKNLLLNLEAKSKHKLEQINKKLENEIGERKNAEDLAKEMRSKAEASNRAKSQFLANMSHEIRTPMNAIIGFSEILRDEDLSTKQIEYVNIISHSAANLLNLINDILDFSKIESGKLETEIIETSLLQILTEIESVMLPMASDKGIEFKVLQCDSLPSVIKTDPFRIRQCLINLVNNAIKFTSKGHVFLNVSLVNPHVPMIEFSIEDTGIGIEENKQKEIFKSFSQASNSTSRNFGGTGLGLTITKQLANLLGGELIVKSKPGLGSTFILTIPANIDIEKQTHFDKYYTACKMSSTNISKEEPVLFDAKALVAEDCKTNQQLAKIIFEKIGMDVTIVENGELAVEAVASEDFDMIFMDMQMPVMNGYEAVTRIKEINKKTPIVAVTANALNGDAQKCTDAGCDDYLAKPFEKEQLIEILKKHLPENKQLQQEQIFQLQSQVDQMTEICKSKKDDTAEDKKKKEITPKESK